MNHICPNTSLTSLFFLLSTMPLFVLGGSAIMVRWLWSTNCGPSWVVVRWSWVMGSMVMVLILGCGSWSDVRGSWSDGPLVMGYGLMVQWLAIVVRWLWVVGPTIRWLWFWFLGHSVVFLIILIFFFLLLFMVASGSCWWLVPGGGNGGWMWYELGSKYLRIKYLESLLFCIGKPRLKHI